MTAIGGKTGREILLQEIFDTLCQWPEQDRRVFSQAHYHGQSPEAISCSLKIDIIEVSAILSRCDRRLHASLRGFRQNSIKTFPLVTASTECPRPFPARANGIAAETRIAV
jgi:hypothetical protein